MMTRYNYLLLLLTLTIIGCQSERQKAYNTALASGAALSNDETTTVKVGEQLLYVYQFSAGVEDIHYKLSWTNSDESVVQYVENPEFYLGKDNVSGGPSAGIHILKAVKEGKATLQFYNDNYNMENYRNEAQKTPFDAEAVRRDFYASMNRPMPDTALTEEQIAEADAAWFGSVELTIDATIDSLMPIHVEKYAFHEEVSGLLDELYNAPPLKLAEQWYEAKLNYERTFPLHKDTRVATCRVNVVK